MRIYAIVILVCVLAVMVIFIIVEMVQEDGDDTTLAEAFLEQSSQTSLQSAQTTQLQSSQASQPLTQSQIAHHVETPTSEYVFALQYGTSSVDDLIDLLPTQADLNETCIGLIEMPELLPTIVESIGFQVYTSGTYVTGLSFPIGFMQANGSWTITTESGETYEQSTTNNTCKGELLAPNWNLTLNGIALAAAQ